MLVSGLHLTVVRAVERGEPLERLAPELKAVSRRCLQHRYLLSTM